MRWGCIKKSIRALLVDQIQPPVPGVMMPAPLGGLSRHRWGAVQRRDWVKK
eukprot:COSAG01_NODE_23711_length_804_cov_1.580142_1_plen_50_part_10